MKTPPFQTHGFEPDPDDGPQTCQHCPLPRGNAVHRGGFAPPDPYEQPAAVLAAVNAAASGDHITLVDNAIRRAAMTWATFSANETRVMLAALPKDARPLIGARFKAMARAREIVETGELVKSTDGPTHGHRIAEYRKGPALRAPLKVPA